VVLSRSSEGTDSGKFHGSAKGKVEVFHKRRKRTNQKTCSQGCNSDIEFLGEGRGSNRGRIVKKMHGEEKIILHKGNSRPVGSAHAGSSKEFKIKSRETIPPRSLGKKQSIGGEILQKKTRTMKRRQNLL